MNQQIEPRDRGGLASPDLARFHLLASAMVGRTVRVEPAPADEVSYTDGHVIYLGGGGADHSDLSGLTVQSALLAAGSLDLSIMRRLQGRPSSARRYLAVEGWRALAAMAGSLPDVAVVAEARHVELLSASPEESLTVATSRQGVPDLPAIFGTLRPRRVLAAAPIEDRGDLTPGDRAQQRLIEEEDLPELDDDEETESAPMFLKLVSSPLQIPLIAKLMKKLGARRQPGSGDADGSELATRGSRATTKPGSKSDISLSAASLLPTEVATHLGWGWRYPEWNAHRGSYRPNWCTVIEVDPRPEDARQVDLPRSTDLRRRLARLGVGLERRRRQPQGDDVDVDAAVESRVDLLAGYTPDEGLYVESQRRRRDLAVLMLLDISGSVAERSATQTSAHEQQRQAAAMLLDAFHVLGDRVAVYGFRSHGRSSVYMVRVKTFDEVVSDLTYQRLGGLAPGGYTRLGAAIRHSSRILSSQAGTGRRLLLVLSDGVPYDDDYEDTYAESDARRSLGEARRQGIGCLCLTLGASSGEKALNRVFGTAAHASAPRLDDLSTHIGPLFRWALASADLQRRLAQRDRQGAA